MRPHVRVISVLLCLTAIHAHAEDAPPAATPEAAAAELVRVVAADDEGALLAVARRQEPDPWLVADALLAAGHGDVADAFAGAAEGVDVQDLPAYLSRSWDPSALSVLRDVLRAVQGARRQGDAEAVEALWAQAPALDAVPRVVLLTQVGASLRGAGRLEESADAFLQGARLAERLGWLRGASALLHEASRSAMARGDVRLALSHWQRKLDLDERRGSTEQVARVLGNIGNAYLVLGDLPKARSHYERCLKLSEEIGDRQAVASSTANLGTVAYRLGNHDEALRHWEHALGIHEERGDLRGMATTLGSIGDLHRLRGDARAALRFDERMAELFERLGDRSGMASAQLSLGEDHLARGDYRAAIACFTRCLDVREALGERGGVASVLSYLGHAHYRVGQYDKACTHLERSLAIAEELDLSSLIQHAAGNLATVRLAMGDVSGAITGYRRSLALIEQAGTTEQRAAVLGLLGGAYAQRGDLPRALSYYRRQLRASEELGDPVQVAAGWLGVGGVQHALGAYGEALSAYERSLALSEEIGDRQGVATTLANLGSLYAELGDGEKAMRLAERALAVLEAIGDVSGVSRALSTMARILADGGETEEAIELRRRSLVLAEQVGEPGRVLRLLGDVGSTYARQGNHREALRYHERSLALAEQLEAQRVVAVTLGNIGSDYAGLGETQRAVTFLEKAMRAARRCRDPHVLAMHLWSLASLHLGEGQPGRALLRAQQARSEIAGLLGGLAEEEGASLRGTFAGLFETGAVAAARLGDAGEMTAFLEDGRSGSLLETLGSAEALRLADLPEALVEAENEARDQETMARHRHERALVAGDLREIRAAARAVDEAMEMRRAVAARIQREAKRVAGVFYPRAATLEEIQGWMEPGAALVLYGLCLDEALALVLTPDDGRIVSLGSRADVEALCARAGPLLAQPGDRGPLASETSATGFAKTDALFADLRAALVEPLGLGEEVDSILVSPDGVLGYLPWGALFDRPVAGVPSGTTWVLLREEERDPGEKILALGDPVYGDRPAEDRALAIYTRGAGLTPLPATRDEAMAIGDVVLLGEDANETRLQEAVKEQRRWRAVHLACHGLVDAERPTLSSLALSPTDEDDGFLTCLDVFRMEIPADLVTLSACETAKGKVVKAEGIVGLTRAFMYAGAPRVLCSLWKVDDEATAALMAKFYEHWNPEEGDGLPAADALREAQSHVRSQEQWAHPYYWAAWVLWGLSE